MFPMATITIETPTVNESLALLRDRGWSDRDIADALEVHQKTVYRWRTGIRQAHPDKPIAMALASLLQEHFA